MKPAPAISVRATSGLAGAGGVVAANLAGKLADAHRHRLTTAVSGLLLTGSFGLLAAGTLAGDEPE